MGLPDDAIAADRALSTREDRRPSDGATGPLTYLSIRIMAERLGVSPSTVARRRQRQPDYQPDDDGRIRVHSVVGHDGKRRPNRRVDTLARDAKIVYRRSEGASIRAIAAELGCSVGTVHRVLSL